MSYICEKCGKEFDSKREAEKHEDGCKKNDKSNELKQRLPEKIKKKLEGFLNEKEEILYNFKVVFGTHSRWTDSSTRTSSRFLSGGKVEGAGTQWGSPWLILTDERVLIIGKGLLTLDIREIPYEYIKSLDYEQGVLQDRLMILAHSSTEAIQFYRADRKITKEIPSIIKRLIAKGKTGEKEIRSPSLNYDEIEKIHSLMEKGIITKKEFDTKKKQILKV